MEPIVQGWQVLLTLNGRGPLYQQVYRAVRSAILSGQMPAGSRLAATRSISTELGISRNVVLIAYELLIAEGYVTGRAGSGTFVNSLLPDVLSNASNKEFGQRRKFARKKTPLSAYAKRTMKLAPQSALAASLQAHPAAFNFQFGSMSTEDFPFRAWRRIITRRALPSSNTYGPPEGNLELRKAVGEHLRRSRGVVCDSSQVVIVNGSQQAIDIAARVLLNPGDLVVMENPHYLSARAVFLGASARIVGIPVDSEGLRVSRVIGDVRRAKLVYVTPSHQFPTGAILALDRRLQLLNWAAKTGAIILEDDYDGEYRYDDRPLESLQGLDRGESVIYLGTFSRAISPALRLGYLVVPPKLVKPFHDAKWLADRHAPTLPQEVLADFMKEHHFERYLRRARARNEKRRAVLLKSLAAEFGDSISVLGAGAGIHVMVKFKRVPAGKMRLLIARAADAGVKVHSTTAYYLNSKPRSELLLGYGGMVESSIAEGIRILKSVVDGLR